jgi:hypothetical protein
MKTFKVISTVALMSCAILVSSVAFAGNNEKGRGTGPTVFVTTQGLYYDSIVVADLPKKGSFQKLVPIAPGVLMTEFGPGDVGYLGGRWYIDANGNDEVDYDEPTFLCPLLGPGEE